MTRGADDGRRRGRERVEPGVKGLVPEVRDVGVEALTSR